MRDDRYPTLARLMAAYYHQDWPLDAADLMDPFEEFIREEPSSEVEALSRELRAFCMEELSEDVLAQRVEAMWGEVSPEQASEGYAAWFAAMRERLAIRTPR